MRSPVDRARFAALLAMGVAVVAAKPDVSDVGTDRFYELHRVLPAFEYPVLARALFLAERAVSGSRTGISLVNAGVGVAAAVAVLVVLRRGGARAEVWAAAPALVLVAQTMDAVTSLLLAAIVIAWQDERSGLAGVWVGLGAAFKVVPAVAALPLLVALARRRGAGAVRMAAAAAGTWAAVNVPYAMRDVDRWWFPYRFAAERDDRVATIWAPWQVSIPTVNKLSLIVTAVLVGAVCIAVWRGRLAPLAGAPLAVLAFIVANKVWQPHYVLWLVVLLAFVPVAVRPLRALEVASLAYFAVFWSEPGVEGLGGLVWVVAVARLAAAGWLAVELVRGATRAGATSPVRR